MALDADDVTVDDLLAWTQDFRRWDEFDNVGLGAANYITDKYRRKAAQLVRTGQSVSMSHPVIQGDPMIGFPVLPSYPDAPNRLIRSFPALVPPFISDSYAYTGSYHGSTHSHVDALGCHVLFQPPDLPQAVGWNGFTAAGIQAEFGCPEDRGGITAVRNGIFARAILLDIPLMKGKEWLDQEVGMNEFVTGADVVAFEKFAHVKIGPGDVVLLYTGRWKREALLGPPGSFAGWHASAIPLLYDRQVSYIGSDGIGDAFPSGFGFAPFILPVHQIVMPFLGINILDNLDLEEVVEVAREENRWEFLITASPLVIEKGLGSPANPIATF